MQSTNLHNVKKVELSEIDSHDGISAKFYTRHLSIQTEEGEIEFTLFSDNRNGVEVETKKVMKI